MFTLAVPPGPEGQPELEQQQATDQKLTRDGAGLCLSGGGYRALLFHLGACRRLNELGLLARVRTVSSVSGGSLLAGLLASSLDWPLEGALPTPDWNRGVADLANRLCSEDIRTGPILSRLLPWNWRGKAAVHGVAARLAPHFRGRALTDLPKFPRFLFCASDLNFGVNWTFTGDASGDYQAGYLRSSELRMPLALAAATSACFPPVFAPLTLSLRPHQMKKGKASRDPEYAPALAALQLNDGGNYDNLGLEPVWKSHALVLVSDGGAPFAFGRDGGPLWRRLRFAGLADAQARALRRRSLMAGSLAGQYRAVYWSVGGHARLYASKLPPDAECLRLGYPEEVAQAIGRVRTDLNVFTPGEQAVLENHGYLLADAALRAYLPTAAESVDGVNWKPGPWPALQMPHPEWLDPEKAMRAVEPRRPTVTRVSR